MSYTACRPDCCGQYLNDRPTAQHRHTLVMHCTAITVHEVPISPSTSPFAGDGVVLPLTLYGRLTAPLIDGAWHRRVPP